MTEHSAENDACEVHVPGRDRPSPWCASCRLHSVIPPGSGVDR